MISNKRENSYSISEVVVNGKIRTRDSYFINLINYNIQNNHTFQEFVSQFRHDIVEMQSHDLFKGAKVRINPKKGNTKAYDITIDVNEKSIATLRTNTYVKSSSTDQRADLGAEVSLALRNMLGFAEVFSTTYGTNSDKKKNGQVNMQVPFVNSACMNLDVSFKQYNENISKQSSYETDVKLFSVGLSSRDRAHSLATNLFLREENCQVSDNKFVRNASRNVLRDISSSAKYALTYTFQRDSTDCKANPTHGQVLDASLEVATPASNTSAPFFKYALSGQKHIALLPQKAIAGPVLSLCVGVGSVIPIGSSGIAMSDKLYAGGPMSIRGLGISGIGPRAAFTDACVSAGNDSLGGLTKFTGFAGISCPFPNGIGASQQCSSFVFINTGSLIGKPLTFFGPSKATLTDILRSSRISVGVGLAAALGPARIEATYSVPILKANQDLVKNFQLGIGLSIQS